VLFYYARRLPKSVLIYDGVTLVPEFIYLAFWPRGLRLSAFVVHLIVSVSAYVATALVFARFAIFGWQVLGPKFWAGKAKKN